MTEVELADAIVRHALELQAVANHDEAAAVRELDALADDLRQLLNRRTLSSATKRDLAAILTEAEKAIAGRYSNIAGVVDLSGIAEHVAQRTIETIRTGFPALTMPTAERIASLAKSILIDGARSAAWWAKQAEDTQFRFAAIVRRGVINGETNEQIVARIAGRNGLLDIARRNARSLVHSSVMTAANRARLDTYRNAFGKQASGVRWLATLDSHTCPSCAALDGSEWGFEGKRLGTTALEFTVPPKHWNCRCVLTPVLATKLDEIFGVKGLDEKLKPTVRASSQGPVQNMTFAQFLKRQSPEFIDEVLGAKRAELYRQGKITLTDLVTKSGRVKALDELR